jgi:glycosyltransferase XagB
MMNIITHRHDAESDFSDALPVLPFDLIPNLIDHMTAAEIDDFLRYKILPVAQLPHLSLYAIVDKLGETKAKNEGLRLVARLLPHDFQKAVFHCLGKSLLLKATYGLEKSNRDYSAHRRFTGLQIAWGLLLLAGFAFAALGLASQTLIAIGSLIFGFFFLSVIAVRLLGLLHRQSDTIKHHRLPSEDLPVYSVLVPVFKETSVLKQLLGALQKLNYPPKKLDIKIIVEEKDVNMRAALLQHELPAHFEIIVVPEGKPQTKPRALNYALQFARG